MKHERVSISFDIYKKQESQLNFNKKTIGEFEIGEKIGQGTFSKVCIGTHLGTQEKVAIKILEKKNILKTEDKLRIEKEIKILKELRHPNLIQIYSVIESPNSIYIITEHCPNGELFDYIISQRKLSEDEACRIFRQLIFGIDYLHSMRIVHRDLKPENILFDHRREVKIADFGLSCSYTGLIATPCGSPCYAAPEMVTGKLYTGPAVDIWSCGVILYTMVCGYLPFEEENQEKLFKSIANGKYDLPAFLSSACKEIIKGILNVDPNRRFRFDDIRAHPWFNGTGTVPKVIHHFPMAIGLNLKEYHIPLDEVLVREISCCTEEPIRSIVSDVLTNRHNNTTTYYYLLLKKKLREGYESVADISVCSNIFTAYLNEGKFKRTSPIDKLIEYYMKRIAEKIQSTNNIETEQVQAKEEECAIEEVLISKSKETKHRGSYKDVYKRRSVLNSNVIYLTPTKEDKIEPSSNSEQEDFTKQEEVSSKQKSLTLSPSESKVNKNLILLKGSKVFISETRRTSNLLNSPDNSPHMIPPSKSSDSSDKMINIQGGENENRIDLPLSISNKPQIKIEQAQVLEKTNLEVKGGCKVAIVKERLVMEETQIRADPSFHYLNTEYSCDEDKLSNILTKRGIYDVRSVSKDKKIEKKVTFSTTSKPKPQQPFIDTSVVKDNRSNMSKETKSLKHTPKAEVSSEQSKPTNIAPIKKDYLLTEHSSTSSGIKEKLTRRILQVEGRFEQYILTTQNNSHQSKPLRREAQRINKFADGGGNLFTFKSEGKIADAKNEGLVSEKKNQFKSDNKALPDEDNLKSVSTTLKPDRIKDIIIALIGKEIKLQSEKLNCFTIECKTSYKTITLNTHFILAINKLKEFKDYYLIKPSFINGNRSSYENVYNKLRNKLILL